MTNEARPELSDVERVRSWMGSEEGSLTRRTVTGIYYHQHYESSILEELYSKEVTEQLPIYRIDEVEEFSTKANEGDIDYAYIRAEKLQALKDKMPISNVRNAIYFIDMDRFIFGLPDTFLMHRVQTEQLQKKARERGRMPVWSPSIFGLSYRVKSTGWNVLDVYPLFEGGYSMQTAANNLSVRGYHLIAGTEDQSLYIPPGKDKSYYEMIYKNRFE